MLKYGIPAPPPPSRPLNVGTGQVLAYFLGPELSYGVVKRDRSHVRPFNAAEDGTSPLQAQQQAQATQQQGEEDGGGPQSNNTARRNTWRQKLELAIAEAIELMTAEDEDEEEDAEEEEEQEVGDDGSEGADKDGN